uniref:Uncharacterized protein n=1 Tax=Laticauda laticaudata TaxID=8630 RepID=A0A8C5WRS4_LATLA
MDGRITAQAFSFDQNLKGYQRDDFLMGKIFAFEERDISSEICFQLLWKLAWLLQLAVTSKLCVFF